jgi:hypothetical protein
MRIHLHTLKLDCRKSEEVIHFARNVTFIHGILSLGKSTVARLVDFCLGGDLELTTAVQRELLGAQLTLTIAGYNVLIERSKGENRLRVTWTDNEADDTTSILIRAKGDGPVVYGADVVNLSDLLFYLLGYPIIRVRKRTGDDSSPMVRLSFRDLLKFCYLEQEDLDSSFFRLNTPILAEKSKDALNFFMGYYSEALSTLQTQFDNARSEQRALRDAAERIRTFLADFGFASEGDIDGELNIVSATSEAIRTTLLGYTSDYRSNTHFVDERRAVLRRMSDELEGERETLRDLEIRVEEQRELKSEITSMKFKLARADKARVVLEGSAFEHCPQCGQPISSHRSTKDHCYLCLQVIESAGGVITPASMTSDMDARLSDIETSLRRYSDATRRQIDRIASLTAEKARLDREVADLISTYESDWLARTRSGERELAELEERSRFLKRVRAMPGSVTSMTEKADAMSVEIGQLERAILDEQRRLGRADENFSTLESYFLEALLATRVPGVGPKDKIVINRRTLIPEVWPNGEQESEYSFYTAGSGGKKTLFTICFALALHRTAAVRKLPVPTLLIIDTPLKNITPEINPILVRAFYNYLYTVAENDLPAQQIIIIDQALVIPPEDSDLGFVHRLMAPDDPDNPPLISYYSGP